MVARIRIPPTARAGQVVTVQLAIQHPMESGYRVDDNGKQVPKNSIRKVQVKYNGAQVLNARLSPGIAANPYLEFDIIAKASGELEITWADDIGETETVREQVKVTS
jgi:sulfur-oxidizing protein SoxZ